MTINGVQTIGPEPLIEECLDYRFLKEDGPGSKKYHVIEGIFLQSNRKNRNKRFYPFDVMLNEVNRYTDQMINRNRAVGELGHPAGPIINPERVSHKIISLAQNGFDFIGKARISNSPFGRIVQNFLDEEIQLGVSSRGLGSLSKQGGVDYVQSDFMLATPADIVMDPSAPDAFVRAVMESKEYILAEGLIQEASFEEWRKEIKNASINQLRQAELDAYQEFLTQLDNRFNF